MKRIITTCAALLMTASVISQTPANIYVISPTVGDTIDAEEKIKFGLFPYLKTNEYQYGIIYQLSDSAYLLKSLVNDSIVENNLSKETIIHYKKRIEKLESINSPVQDTPTYRFIKTDGGELIGTILSQDAREILILTNDNREIYLPQHTIKEMVAVNTSDFNYKGDFIGEDKFATRYFITTNGLPIKKGEHYVQWNLFGPDFQFGVGDNFGIGLMTSWIGMPVIGTIKKSWQLGEKTQFAIGGLIGTGSWIRPDFGGALPFGTLSFGDRSKNIAFSAGYGAIWANGNSNGRAITSIAGMIKVSPKISLVFDSFILLPGPTETVTTTQGGWNDGEYYTYDVTSESRKPGFALLIPGVRWHKEEGKAIQFGFAGMVNDGETLPVPIPMVQWYRSF